MLIARTRCSIWASGLVAVRVEHRGDHADLAVGVELDEPDRRGRRRRRGSPGRAGADLLHPARVAAR